MSVKSAAAGAEVTTRAKDETKRVGALVPVAAVVERIDCVGWGLDVEAGWFEAGRQICGG